MESIRIDLYGHLFAECFSFSSNYRAAHEMEDDACLTYIEQGTHELFSPTQKLVVKQREALLMKCGNYIANVNGVSATSQLTGFVIHLDPVVIKRAFGDRDLSFLKVAPRREGVDPAFMLGRNVLIESFMDSLKPYFSDPSHVNDDLLAVKLQELVTILAQYVDNDHVRHILGTLKTPEYIEFDKVIEANTYNNMTIAEMAHLAHRSESTFKRDFRKYYGTSPAKYFKNKKLERAADLLRNTETPISQIAWDCGFENTAHFSTSFSKKYHRAPKAYRSDPN